MTRIRTVTLELLRHGPPHNQLLSPLTRYLGLCGNYGAATVNVPYEHGEVLSRLKMLRYQDPSTKAANKYNDATLANEAIALQREQIEQMAEKMAEILQSIPGLVSELNEGPDGDKPLTHLRLVLSPSELALLPFELSKVPAGCKGGRGNWLTLQPHAPVCITREVRGINAEHQCWSRKPRILFAFAATSDMETLVQAHTNALTKSIRPWLHYFDSDQPGELEKEFKRHLTILPNATIEQIEAACSGGAYTHVHILAHGAQDKTRTSGRYGIKLYRRRGTKTGNGAFETICGEQLALALGATRAPCPGGTAPANGQPLVVTVASCDSGNQGNVIYDGASFAHELHQSGIPLVVASQFPLSFAGSVIMAEELYKKMMCGVDPRLALHTLRAKLYALHDPGVHDWAALVAYTALPDDLSSRLIEFRYLRARDAIEASMSHVDAQVDSMVRQARENRQQANKTLDLPHLIAHVDRAAGRLPTDPDYLTEAMGLHGTVEKRKAETYFRVAKSDTKNRAWYFKQSLSSLKQAHLHYFDATRETLKATDKLLRNKRELHWPLTQYLSLSLVIEGGFNQKQWQTALFSTEIELSSSSQKTRTWARWSSVELCLLKAVTTNNERERKQLEKQIDGLVTDLVRESHRYKFATYSSRRQFERYVSWWSDEDFIKFLPHSKKDALVHANELAKKVLDMLPHTGSD